NSDRDQSEMGQTDLIGHYPFGEKNENARSTRLSNDLSNAPRFHEKSSPVLLLEEELVQK
ncbi:16782_t:CDS:1, partial [Dentiscutata erythropus]